MLSYLFSKIKTHFEQKHLNFFVFYNYCVFFVIPKLVIYKHFKTLLPIGMTLRN